MSTSSTTPPGFVYGRSVRSSEFLDRKDHLRTVVNRLRQGESTAIVGEPHIGKSSLLLKLADKGTQRAYLGNDVRYVATSLLDLQPIGRDYTPAAFWREALEPLGRQFGDTTTGPLLKQVAQSGYSRRPLERLFGSLSQRGRKLVVMLDEFESLLGHPNFQEAAFFALLRSLATRTGALVVITASRLSVAEMNEHGLDLLEVGSPFFNNVIELRLRPFDDKTVGRLLDRGGDAFSPEDRRFIRRSAGRHPFLVQAMAASMVETKGEDRQARAAVSFYERISFHFDDVWRALDDRTRTTAVILSLVELGKRAHGERFACGEIENTAAFDRELRRLGDLGLAERAGEGWQFDWEHLLLWRGERWTIGTQAFAWWVRDVVIAEARWVPDYDEWLAKKRYRLFLTEGQWDRLVSITREAPGWAVRGVGALARALFEELLKRY